jgi:hypothetical protein
MSTTAFAIVWFFYSSSGTNLDWVLIPLLAPLVIVFKAWSLLCFVGAHG